MSEWQDIGTAPKDGTWILTYRRLEDGRDEVDRCRWQNDWMDKLRFEWGGEGWSIPDFAPQPTHWMPLPDPPAPLPLVGEK